MQNIVNIYKNQYITENILQQSSLRIFKVRGVSMEPDISPGDVVLVQLKEGLAPRNGAMFVVRVAQELLIKRVFIAPGGKLQLISTNAPPQDVYPGTEGFHIMGIPHWIGRTL